MLEAWGKAASDARNRSRYFSRGLHRSTDPEERFRHTLWYFQRQIDEAAGDGKNLQSAADELQQRVLDSRLVAWYFNRYVLVSKDALPPGLGQLRSLRLICCQDEIEPAAFYISNLGREPSRVHVRIEAPEGVTTTRYVDAREGRLNIIRPLGFDPQAKKPREGDTRDVAPYIDLWIPHHGTVYAVDPLRDPDTVAQRMPNHNAAILGLLREFRKKYGAKYWTYHQYGTEDGSYRECPVMIFRHHVWKTIWGMQANGVSFFAHYYVTGHLKYPCKGWEAFREGVEDVEWALLLKKAIEDGKVDQQTGRVALREVDRLGCGLDWWIEQPAERSDDMDWARLVAMRALLGHPVRLPETRQVRCVFKQ